MSAPRSLAAHARHVLTENPVTLFAAILFALLVVLAIAGPAIAPYDPSRATRRLRFSRPRRSTGSAPMRWVATCCRG